MATYSKKLKDPRWQRKRLEIMQRDNFSCYWCGDKETTLNVHHEVYIGKNPWETPNECLTTLCEDCHSLEHLDMTELERHLLFCIRCRDKDNTYLIKLTNKAIRRYKGVLTEQDLINDEKYNF